MDKHWLAIDFELDAGCLQRLPSCSSCVWHLPHALISRNAPTPNGHAIPAHDSMSRKLVETFQVEARSDEQEEDSIGVEVALWTSRSLPGLGRLVEHTGPQLMTSCRTTARFAKAIVDRSLCRSLGAGIARALARPSWTSTVPQIVVGRKASEGQTGCLYKRTDHLDPHSARTGIHLAPASGQEGLYSDPSRRATWPLRSMIR